MTVSSISGASPAYVSSTGSSGQKNDRALWAQLSQSLSSNNLAGAQSAFASIAQNFKANHPSGPSGSAPSGGTGALATDVQQLSAALQSGSLSSAQAAFATLQQAYQASGSSGAQSSTTSTTGSTSVNVLA